MKKTHKTSKDEIIMSERKNTLEGINGRLGVVENIIKLETY